MDIFDQGLLQLWASLNKYQVRYIMVGGIAINMHGTSVQHKTQTSGLKTPKKTENSSVLLSKITTWVIFL
jgi:hypothetical protein